ncbi:hypothetical protein CW733_00300 [Lacinutrix sp. Bg11-31]|nr:hypothetical protein CW733_00300 [Lacinutrix sp. Bg11-31]
MEKSISGFFKYSYFLGRSQKNVIGKIYFWIFQIFLFFGKKPKKCNWKNLFLDFSNTLIFGRRSKKNLSNSKIKDFQILKFLIFFLK